MTMPDALPLLTSGSHLSPYDGACLMELVSVLAGRRWSDHPGCTDATLATIARVVNDELGHTARQRIAPLAVDLIDRTGDPAVVAPTLVHTCLTVAQPYVPEAARVLDRHRRRADRRLAAQRRPARRGHLPQALVARIYARGPAQHAIATMVRALGPLPGGQRDTALRAVLEAAIRAVPRTTGVGRRDLPATPSAAHFTR